MKHSSNIFFPKAQMKEDYLRIAKIEGDEDKVLDYLNSLLEERRGQVIKTSEILRNVISKKRSD